MFYYSNKLIIKVLVLSLLLLTPWMNIAAAPLTPEQALNRIKSSSSAKKVFGKTPYVLAYTEKYDNNDYLFVFNRNNDGFIIASADDRMPALLGYSDNGAFDISTAAPGLKWLLEQYAMQASVALESGIPLTYSNSQTRASRDNIDPLISTQWNQRDPFNQNCPSDANGKCVTGCVATAMAQVIKYHNYPTSGVGDHKYEWNGKNLSFDYGKANFDFANMLDVYDNTATQEQKDAVANLMYACGVSVDMKYSSNESGAQDSFVASALKKYFNYDAGIRYLRRDYFTDDDWENIVYDELEAGRPVIYGGHGETGGHEFVCDGFENGLFHINWGWGGISDGCFSLDALRPNVQGIGGTQYEYNNSQTMVCGIQPNQNNQQSWYPLYATGGIIATEIYNSQIFITFTNGGIFNYSHEEVIANFQIKAIPESGGAPIYSEATQHSFAANDEKNYGKGSFWLNLPTGLSEGNYKLSVVFKLPNGNYQDMPIPVGMSDYIEISVSENGNIVLNNEIPEIKPTIEVTEFFPKTDVISGEVSEFVITVINNSLARYNGKIFIRVFDSQTNDKLAENSCSIDLPPFYSINQRSVELIYKLSEGDYKLQIFDKDDNIISDVLALTILPSPYDPKSISLDKTDVSLTQGESLTLTAEITPETASNVKKTWVSSNEEVATVDAEGNVKAVGVGKAIITVTCGNVSAQCAISCYPIIGDANWDGTIAINDAVDIANFVVKKKVAPNDWDEDEWIIFYTVGANANQSEDGRISFADASATVNLALAQEVSTTSQNRINTYRGFHEAADALVIGSVTYNNQGHLFAPVTLDNSMNYVALQADITGPEGTSIDIKEGSRIAMSHSLVTRRIKDNMIRVAIFNLGNLSFADNNEPILEVITDSNGLDSENITISNIIASDADANGYVLVSRLGNTTGMIGVSNDKVIIAKIPNGIQINNIIGKKVLIYTLDGKIINSFEASQDSEIINLSSGVYVVKVGDQTLKIVL